VLLKSVRAPHEQVIVEVENCGPFGCTNTPAVDREAPGRCGGALGAIKAAMDFIAERDRPFAAHVPARICHLFDAATGRRIERP
jgi:hypothetical protein